MKAGLGSWTIRRRVLVIAAIVRGVAGRLGRQLGVDEATGYVMHRWPLNLGSSIAARLRAAVRFSEEH